MSDAETNSTTEGGEGEHYPLAWDQHGDPIELPPEAAAWRVKRHQPSDSPAET